MQTAAQPQQTTRRFASPAIAARYPLAVDDPLEWRSRGTRHRVSLSLASLTANQLLVPSFSMLSANYGFQFAVEAMDHRWTLSPIHCKPLFDDARCDAMETHIDYFHTQRPVDEPRLVLEVESDRPPQDYLLSIAIRAPRIEPLPGSRTSRRLIVAPVSQMTAPRMIRHHICSPTCVAMVLRHYGIDTHLGEIAKSCYHKASHMFGVWPAALHTASRFGVIGAVETFADTDTAAELADLNIPLIASIRFAAGQLTGAPQERTGGHLVVTTGWEKERVWVNDPCARDPRDVCTSYARDEFARAWLTQRGAGYVLVPP